MPVRFLAILIFLFPTLSRADDGDLQRALLEAACAKSPFGKWSFWDSWVGGFMIQALDVDTRAAGPDGRDRPKDEALPVGSDG